MLKLLICDDEAIIRQGIHKIVENAYTDTKIEECENGADGYKKIATFEPNLVITDIKMPVMNGISMIEKASQLEMDTQYIIISAYSDFDYARSAIKFGVKDYILKPINRFELINCINKVMGIQGADSLSAEKNEVADHSIVSRAIQYIENNFYKDISLEDVSKAVHMNTNYFSALFKKHTGMKYINYLTDLRMEKAHNLICSTDLKINNISEMVGYNSTKHFTRTYKEKYGVTPSCEREK